MVKPPDITVRQMVIQPVSTEAEVMCNRIMANLLLSGLLILVTVVWGWTFVVVRDSVMAYSVLGFLTLRFTIASLCLGPISFKRLGRGTFVAGAGIGICLAGGYLLQTYGLRYTTPTNSGLITGLFVVFAPVAGLALFRARIDRVFLLPLGACLVGTLLLVGDSPEEIRIGDGLTLGCAACFGLHIALLSHYAHRHDATALALAQMIATALLCGIPWLFFESPSFPPGHVWFALVITGVLASALAFAVQTYVQQRLPATRTAIILTMEPVFAVFFGYLLAGDRLSWVQIFGALLILFAIAASELFPALKRD